jgi:hypothetical protein
MKTSNEVGLANTLLGLGGLLWIAVAFTLGMMLLNDAPVSQQLSEVKDLYIKIFAFIFDYITELI